MKRLGLLMALAIAGCGGTSPAVQQTPAAVIRTLDQTLVAFTGDSITVYWNSPYYSTDTDRTNMLSSHLPDFIDAGVGGQTSVQIAARFQTDVLTHSPAVIVIDAGTNDVALLQSGDTSQLFEMIRVAQDSGAVVIVGTLPPASAPNFVTPVSVALHGQWNEAIRMGAQQYGYVLADYFKVLANPDGSQNVALFESDGVHPNPAGYALMWKALMPLLPAAVGAH